MFTTGSVGSNLILPPHVLLQKGLANPGGLFKKPVCLSFTPLFFSVLSHKYILAITLVRIILLLLVRMTVQNYVKLCKQDKIVDDRTKL